MNLKFIFFMLTLLLFACRGDNKSVNATNANEVKIEKSDTIQSISLNQDSLVISDFKEMFLKACAELPSDFVFDTVRRLEHPNDKAIYLSGVKIESSDLFKFTLLNDSSTSATASYSKCVNVDSAMLYIDLYCEKCRSTFLKGERMETPSFAFRIGSSIYQFESTENIRPILIETYNRLLEKYKVDIKDVIPCQRKYISAEIISKIRPKIRRWLNYYDLAINRFEFEGDKAFLDYSDFEKVMNDTTHYYYKNKIVFSPLEDDVYNLILFAYSPDKTKYLDLNYHGHPSLEADGKYHFIGGDDSQAIFYFDRKKQQSVYLVTFGISQYVEAAFWLNNNDFILVGQKNYQDNIFFILHVGENGGYYEYVNRGELMGGYTVYDMKRRGIIMDF